MEFLKNIKVALIQGGLSAEREVSLSTGKSFEAALKELGANYEVIDAGEDLAQVLIQNRPQVALLALHGKYAEDGVVQGLLEYLKIPYTGSGVLSSALCMSKLYSKQLFQFHNIPTPSFMSLNTKNNSSKDVAQVVAKAIKAWGLPLVVKPSREGSSVGITICKAEEDILPAIELASKSDHTVLIEQFIRGKEVTVSILNNEALIPIEIQPKIDFYNYENKYTEGMTEYFVPARFSKEMLAKCQELALRTAEAVNIRTYGRVDFIITEDEEVYVLEVNTLPGCTETSLLPKAAHFHHITYPQLVLELLKGATLDYEDVK